MNLLKNFVDCNLDADYDELKKNYKIKIPQNFNFAYDVVDEYAKIQPEKQAMLWCNDNNEELTFNFKQMSELSKQTANLLVAKGIKKGDRVMLILRRRWEFWPLMLALHRIGAIAIPATNQLLAEDITYRIKSAGIKMIVSFDEGKILKQIELSLEKNPADVSLISVLGGGEKWGDFHSELKKYDSSFERPSGENATCNTDPMLLYFTSGTSGYPKMVVHNFLYPLGHIATAKLWQHVVDDGLHFSIAETGWGKAVWGKLYGQWIAGSSVFVYDMLGFTPDLFFEKLQQYHITTFCAPPTVYRFLIRRDLTQIKTPALKHCVTAGEALNSEVYNIFFKQTGFKMHEGYGQTETPLIAGTFKGMEPRPGSMGKAAPGINLEIVDENGKRCPPNQTGDIVIHLSDELTPGIFMGYYGDEENTKKALDSGTYYTGDTAYYDEDGYIWFVGRGDDLIKSTGYRVSPFEVESVLQQHPAVLECAVTGVPDSYRGQAVKASIVLCEGYEPSNELKTEINTFVKGKLAVYKSPRVIEFVKELPKTISGKIRRVQIRQEDERKNK